MSEIPLLSESEASIPISLVAHHEFCPRRAWIEASGEKLSTSYAMAMGDSAHQRVHDPAASDGSTVRSMDVRSADHRFHGRLDAAETGPSGALRIVEYKATPVRSSATVTEPMRIQLALQAIALEEMGEEVSGAEVFFTSHRRRVPIELEDDDLRSAALDAVQATRSTVESRDAPLPLVDDARCAGCSHVSLCLPDERAQAPTDRRIAVADPDGQVLHLATYGARASLRDGRIRVSHRSEEISSLPIERVHAVVVHGNVDLTSGLLRELLWRGVPISWCSSSGRLVGTAHSSHSPNGHARVRQHVASAEGRVDLAREFVAAKIANQATMLRRHGDAPEIVAALRDLSRRASSTMRVPDLFGVEGAAASAYFSAFPSLIAGARSEVGEDFPGRVGRGATDRVNVCLNYVYGLLAGECSRALIGCGLDPHAGFLHSSGRNKPALALDLMEEFRPIIGDSVVLGAVNNGEVTASGFTDLRGTMRIGDAARKALIAAYERRMSTEFTHPVFRYKITWRRAIEVQARMVLGVLDGTQSRYTGIRTR